MTHEEIEAVAKEYERLAGDLDTMARQDQGIGHDGDARSLHGEAKAFRISARLIREALAKSEAAPLCDNCNHPPHEAHECSGRNQQRGLSRGCECQTHTVTQ